jgi:hypothetical protein
MPQVEESKGGAFGGVVSTVLWELADMAKVLEDWEARAEERVG